MSDVRWLVQTNLGDGENAREIMRACMRLGIEAVGVEPIPFDTKLPEIQESDKKDIFYGSTNFIKNAYGIHPNFNTDMYREHYGSEFLNYDSVTETVGEYLEYLELFDGANDDDEIFIRPVEDIKEFAGKHTTKGKFYKWASKLEDDCSVTKATKIIVALPKQIKSEWRLFIVDGKIITGSFYRCNGQGMFIANIPFQVEEYFYKMSSCWEPDDIYVMDVCQTVDNKLYVVECNGWNSCGFYKSDIGLLVEAITNYTNGTMYHCGTCDGEWATESLCDCGCEN